MLLTRYRPEERFPVFERMNRAFDDAMRNWREEPVELGAWTPSVNVYEKDGDVYIEAELPGVQKDDIDVRVENGVLTLKGERKEEKKVEEKSYFRQERFFGTFLRSFQLPSGVAPDKIEAAFKDGVLTLKVPRTEEGKPKQVSIQ